MEQISGVVLAGRGLRLAAESRRPAQCLFGRCRGGRSEDVDGGGGLVGVSGRYPPGPGVTPGRQIRAASPQQNGEWTE